LARLQACQRTAKALMPQKNYGEICCGWGLKN